MLSIEQIYKFCDYNEDHKIKVPWSRGDYTYSTNGYLIIRIPKHPDVKEIPDAPDASKIFEEAPIPQSWILIPELPELIYENCDVCEGKGQFSYHGKMVPCMDCNGEGRWEIINKMAVNDIFFQVRYLRLIKALPDYKFGTTAKEKPSWFKFDGGDGLIMPCQF